jgi:DNA-directed RNA polymerase beta' subunit
VAECLLLYNTFKLNLSICTPYNAAFDGNRDDQALAAVLRDYIKAQEH